MVGDLTRLSAILTRLREPPARGTLPSIEPPAKKRLLTRNEAFNAVAVLVLGLAFAFVPVVDCAWCGKEYRSVQKEVEASRGKAGVPGSVDYGQGMLDTWTCDHCRGKGRASLMDRLVQGKPPPETFTAIKPRIPYKKKP